MKNDKTKTLRAQWFSSGGSGGGEPTTVSVAVDSTTTLPAGSAASVVNVGTPVNVRLAFSIPQGSSGAKGDKGDKGDTGEQGINNTTMYKRGGKINGSKFDWEGGQVAAAANNNGMIPRYIYGIK